MAARGLGWTLLPVSVAPPEYVLPGLTLLRRTECRFSALNIMLVWKPHVADEKLRVWVLRSDALPVHRVSLQNFLGCFSLKSVWPQAPESGLPDGRSLRSRGTARKRPPL